jgi:hypothetical protein
MTTTRTAIPRTPPIWRTLELTADATAYLPPGTEVSAALPRMGKVAPTPIPLSTCPGSHCPRKLGSTPTATAYQR